MDRGLAWLQPLEEQSSKLQWQWDSHSQHKSLHLNDPSHTSAHQTPTQLPSPRLNVEPEFERPRSREPANSSLSLQPTTSRSRIIIRRTDRRNPLDPGRGSGSLGGTINESSAIIRRIQPRSSKLLLTRRRFLLLQLLILLHKPLDLALNFANPIRKPSPANKWIGPGAAAAAVTSNTNLGLSNGNSDVASGFRSSIQNSHSRPHSREFIHEMGGSHDITGNYYRLETIAHGLMGPDRRWQARNWNAFSCQPIDTNKSTIQTPNPTPFSQIDLPKPPRFGPGNERLHQVDQIPGPIARERERVQAAHLPLPAARGHPLRDEIV